MRATPIAVLLGALMLTACAQIPTELPGLPEPLVPDVAAERKTRELEVAQSFETKRNEAQWLAARSVYRSGDARQAERLLKALLSRAPDHAPARRLVAELYLDRDEPQRALPHLEILAELTPEDASVHHVLGFVYDALGNVPAAERHLQLAAELSPQSGFAQSRDVLRQARAQ